MLSPILTPAIGIVTIINLAVVSYVAYQQFHLKKTNVNYQIHHDLYERRLKVFHETMELLRKIVNEQKPSWNELLTTLRKIEDDAYFLFGDEIHEYIKTLIDKGHEKRRLNRKMDRINPTKDSESRDKMEKALDTEEELESWVFDQFDICRDKFGKYLSYEDFIK